MKIKLTDEEHITLWVLLSGEWWNVLNKLLEIIKKESEEYILENIWKEPEKAQSMALQIRWVTEVQDSLRYIKDNIKKQNINNTKKKD